MQNDLHIWVDPGTAVHVHMREQTSGRPAAVAEAAEPQELELITDPDEMLDVISASGGNTVRQAAEVIRSRGFTAEPPTVRRTGKPQEHYLRWFKGREPAACYLTPSLVTFSRKDDQARLRDLAGTEPRGRETVILLSTHGALDHIAGALAAIEDGREHKKP